MVWVLTADVSMENVIKALEVYLSRVLGVSSKIYPWESHNNLPVFLIESYHFFCVDLFGNSCLLMVIKEGRGETPVLLKKHRNQVQKYWPGPCVIVQESMTSYNRKRLIEHRVPFIVPSNQMYLPDLGLDLREHFRSSKTAKKTLSPATQAVAISFLCGKITKGDTTTELMRKLGYSRMTLVRAFNELRKARVGEVCRKGRELCWSFEGTKQELWGQLEALLRSPVRKRVWVKDSSFNIKAGLTALAEKSMLSGPKIPVYASFVEDWRKKTNIETLPVPEGASAEVELWSYSPCLFSTKGIVDPFSLYLSLKDEEDERVESALKGMMEEVVW